MREDTLDLKTGKLTDLPEFFLVVNAQPVEAGIDFQVNLCDSASLLGSFRKRLRLGKRNDGLGNAVFHHDVRQARGRVAQDKQRIVGIGLAKLQRFGQRGDGKVCSARFYQRGGDANSTVAVAVGLDYGHNGHILAAHLANQTHVFRDVGQIDFNDCIPQQKFAAGSLFCLHEEVSFLDDKTLIARARESGIGKAGR